MNAFEKRSDFRIWKSKLPTGEWYLACPGNLVTTVPTFRAAVAVMDAWCDRRR